MKEARRAVAKIQIPRLNRSVKILLKGEPIIRDFLKEN